MANVRVYQLAKELKVQSALILELLDSIGSDVKSDLSPIDPDTANMVRSKITSALEVETERIVKAQHELPPEPETVEPAPAEIEATTEEVEETEGVASTPSEEDAPGEDTAVDHSDELTQPVIEPAAPQAAVPVVEPAATRPDTPPAPAPSPTAAAGARYFPAQRRPTAAMLAKARAARTAVATPRPGAPGAPGAPATAPAPGRVPPKPGTMIPIRQTYGPGKKRRRKKNKLQERATAQLAAAKPKPDLPPVPETITLSEGVTVKELAEKLNRKSKDVIAKLIARGVLATINQPLEPDMAIDVAQEFGSTASVISFEEEAQGSTQADTADDSPLLDDTEHDDSKRVERPPIVTVMGHVDHGKTSLLDVMRASSTADSEAGGITQHIGAYQVETNGRKITFLDTPGHEAFTQMRARGAQATDIVVLVVAADDGVKPQTIEAIDHAKAAGIPLVVAINKIDKPNANPDMVKQQLAEREIVVEAYGGETVSCEVSAKKKLGLDDLLEMILLVADMKEIKADPTRPASGIVLETKLDRARGILATMLVKDGTLRIGDPFIAGTIHGKVRSMYGENRSKLSEAGPSTPVEVMGFAAEPNVGDKFQTVSGEAKARQIAAFRRDKERAKRQKSSAVRLEEFSTTETKELRLLLKADVQGSIEALRKALGDLPSDKIKVKLLSTAIGAITQADVLLASASQAIVVGFNVRPNRAASDLAKVEGVELRMYTVIYDMVDDVTKAMVGLLEPIYKEVILGQAEVRQPFKIPKIGMIAGSYVTEGKVTRKAEVRLLRDNVVIFTGKVSSLRRFKDDVAEVKLSFECGIGIANYNDIKAGDFIEFFEMEKIAVQTL
jgi:translation initiation factor IF-2